MMYPSQYRKYMLAWNEAYAVNPQYFNDSGFKWLAKHAKRVGGSYKISNGMIEEFAETEKEIDYRVEVAKRLAKNIKKYLFTVIPQELNT